jgi:hypothetical protein
MKQRLIQSGLATIGSPDLVSDDSQEASEGFNTLGVIIHDEDSEHQPWVRSQSEIGKPHILHRVE